MNDEPLLVMSVYGKNSAIWLDIQKDALKKTTHNYIHAVYLNNIDINCGDSIVVGNTTSQKAGNKQHCDGLNELLKYAKSGKYRGWLFLDCDCFPINSRWEEILKDNNAAVVRTDNLDTFFHPCAVYCKDYNIAFEISNHTNLVGKNFCDVAVKGNFFPMVRSNRLNIDQLKYAVYYDLFYHHGAGSRGFVTRSSGYYNSMNKNLEKYEKLFFQNPELFTQQLVGSIHS